MSTASTEREVAEVRSLTRHLKLANFFLGLIAVVVAWGIIPGAGIAVAVVVMIAALACYA